MNYSSDSTRNVVIIYGFFFVMLSAMLPLAIQGYSLIPQQRFLLYMMAWIMSLTSALIGFGITNMVNEIDRSAYYGLYLLALVVPTFFNFFCGMILLYDFPSLFWAGLVAFIVVSGAFIVLGESKESKRGNR